MNDKISIIDNAGGVKFLYSVLALCLLFVLSLQGIISGQDFVTAVSIIGGTLVIGNVASQVSNDNLKKAVGTITSTSTSIPSTTITTPTDIIK